MPREYHRLSKKERHSENLNIPMKMGDMVRLKAEAEHIGVTRTELARRLIVKGLAEPVEGASS